ncbi:MAG: TonB-dependent receptor [Acidobacteria bacterium]|nr:TonB-dependent receptor [Acidobacteriota bacterium]
MRHIFFSTCLRKHGPAPCLPEFSGPNKMTEHTGNSRRNKWKCASGYLAVFLMLVPGLACAQDSADLTGRSLEDLMNVRVYSASRYSQLVSEAPASVTVISREMIERGGYRTLADILRSVRGFYVSYDRQYSYLGVRGFSDSGDYNTRVLLMVDGHRMNDTIYEQAAIGTDFILDVDTIERVEITRGPSSSLYGTNAVFAVVNVITRKSSDIGGVELAGGAGTFNSYRGRITYGGTIAGVDAILSGSFYGSKGNKHLYYPEYDSPQTNNGIASHVDDDQALNLLATLSTHGLRFQAAYSDREKGDPTGSYGDVFGSPLNREHNIRGFLDLRYEKTVRNTTLMARTYYDREMNKGGFLSEGGADPDSLSLNIGRGENWGAEFQAVSTLRNRYKVVGGLEYRNDFRQEMLTYTVDPVVYYAKSDQPSFVAAPYVEAEIPITSRLSFDPSLRADYNPRVGWMCSPRAAINYNPWDRSRVKLIYGESFRSPNSYEMYFWPGQQPLQSEKIATWEADLEQELNNHVSASLSIFHNRTDHFIAVSADTWGATFVNEGRQSLAGVEAEIRTRWSNGTTATASYSNHFEQEDIDGGTPENSPKHLAKLYLSVPLVPRKLFATADTQYLSHRMTLRGQRVDSYGIVNLTLLGKQLARNLDLSFSVDNLLDKHYSDPGAQQHLQNAIPQDGRNLRAKLTWTFGGR